MLSLKHSPRVLIMILLALLYPFSSLKAQRLLSPEKVKTRFLHANDTIKLMNYDKMLEYEEYISNSTNLHKAGDIILPPSCWGLMVIDERGNRKFEGKIRFLEEGEKCILCWMGLRDSSSEQERRIRSRLKRKYGSVTSSDGKKEGIPSTWITDDTLSFCTYVQDYGGLYTGLSSYHIVQKGNIFLDYHIEGHPRWGNDIEPWNYFDRTILPQDDHNNLHIQVSYLAPELFHTLDSKENYQRSRWAQMLLLAYEANKHCPSSFNKYHVIKDLPIYVYMRKDGRCEMLVLDDSKLKEEDLPYVNELAASLPQTPPLLLSLKFTIDGEMMPGIILYASHEGAWTFREVDQEK